MKTEFPFISTVSPVLRKKIAKACQIAEDGVYMRDYTEDEEGHIACVSFDLIRKM